MNNIAIIPARGGSKRIPGKNTVSFLGKPIIAYSIEVALRSGLFETVMVSTDDEKIAAVAKQYGATVPFLRSKKNADDHATLADVIEEVIEKYKEQSIIFDYACCILPTAPLISIKNLEKGFHLLEKKDVDTVRPVVRFDYPIQRAFKMDNGKLAFMYPEYEKTRSQDLMPAYHDCGQFYWMYFDKGLKGNNRGGFEISSTETQDIDHLEDLILAEIKYKALNERKTN